jgi:hypothetical protein
MGQKSPKRLRLPVGKNTHERMGRIVPEPDQLQRSKMLYSITSSAVASRFCGIVRPSALAVLRLMMSSCLVGA